MRQLQVLADENIPMAREVFAGVGHVDTFHGRTLTRDALKDTDILLVRSVTRVDASLLDDTPVTFVGTATIGLDHIDLPYLRAKNIAFASAPGSNAESVACYVTSTLLEIAGRLDRRLAGQPIAIVGVGNVGKRVRDKALALGMTPLLVDPPRAAKEGCGGFVSLRDALARATWVTVHTPLTRTGRWPTFRMFNAETFSWCRPGAVLLNSGRGDTVDGEALEGALRDKTLEGAALDVWPGEPEVSRELLEMVLLASPHIAGYAIDGKLRGTTMLAEAVGDWLGRRDALSTRQLTAPQHIRFEPDTDGGHVEAHLREICRLVYDIRQDDTAMRDRLSGTHDAKQRLQAFDQLRRHYPVRREFGCVGVETRTQNTALIRMLSGLGFKVKTLCS